MMDSIWLNIDKELVPINFDDRFNDFTNVQTITTEHGEDRKGNFRNFIVKSSEKGVKVIGSIGKYYLGTNQKTLRQCDIIPAFDQLSLDLGLPLFKAKVNRVDIAENIVTSLPIDEYKTLLGDTKHLFRNETINSVAYTSSYRSFNLYNKVKEVKKHQYEELTEIAKLKPLTRVELKIKKHDRIAQMLGLTSVTLEDLIICYPDLVNVWWDTWLAIKKNRERLAFDLEVFKTKGLIDKQLTMMGIEAMGGLKVVTQLIKSARKVKGLFANKDQPGYLLDKYTRIMSTPKLTTPSKLVEELEFKMKTAYFVNAERPQIIYDHLS
jgi:hypothetical protein